MKSRVKIGSFITSYRHVCCITSRIARLMTATGVITFGQVSFSTYNFFLSLWKKFRMVEHLEEGEIGRWRDSRHARKCFNSLESLQYVLDIVKPRNRKDTASLDKVIAVIIARLDHAVSIQFFCNTHNGDPLRENEIITLKWNSNDSKREILELLYIYIYLKLRYETKWL